MSQASTLLNSILAQLQPLVVGQGPQGLLRFLDLFGGDWNALAARKDFLAPGILVHYVSSRVVPKDATHQVFDRSFHVALYLFNSTKVGITERVSGFGDTPGIWEIEDAVLPLMQGFQAAMTGCVSALTKPATVTGTQEFAVSDDFTVWRVDLDFETLPVTA